MFGQTFSPHDIFVIGVLVVLEGVLSIDNALVLGLLARRLPKALQGKALTYGLIGALVFRLLAIATASYLLHWRIAKLLGGLYLVYVAVKHFGFERESAGDEMLAVDDQGQPVLVDHAGHVLTEKQLGPAGPLSSASHLPVVDYAHARTTHSKAFWMAVAVI